MKQKSLLTEEIGRILEMMGINESASKVLLTESIIDDIVQAAVKSFSKSGDDAATVIGKLESEFDVPAGTLNSGRVSELLNPATNAVRKSKIFGEIVSKMGDTGIAKLSQDMISNSPEITKFSDDMLTTINKGIDDGTFVKADGTVDVDEINEFIDESLDNTVRLTDVNYTKLSDQLKADLKNTTNSKVNTTKTTKAGSDEPTFGKVGKTGLELYNEVAEKLQKSEAFNKLPSDVRSKYLKYLKAEAEGNPTMGVKELAEKYDARAQKYMSPTRWKKFKAWKAGLSDTQRYALNAMIVFGAIGGLGGLAQVVPGMWEFIKESGDVITGGFDEFDWDEVVKAWESGETDGGDEDEEEETTTEFENTQDGWKEFSNSKGWSTPDESLWDSSTDSGWKKESNGEWIEYTFKDGKFIPR